MKAQNRSHRLPTAVLAAVVCLTAAVAASWLPVHAASTADKLKAGTEDLGRVRAKIEAANQRIDRAREAQTAQRAAVEAAERKLAESQKALRKLEAEADAQDAKVKSAMASRAAAEARLVKSREQLATQVRSAYVAGQGGQTALLLSQDEPDRIGRLLTYFDYLNRASARQLDEINAEIASVATEQQKVEAELAALKQLEAGQKRAIAALEADRLSRRKAVAELDAKIASDAEQVKTLKSSEQEIQALLKQLKDALAEVPAVRPPTRGNAPSKPFAKSRGTLAWPLRGNILANYGDAKNDSRLQWKGLWIAGAEGTPVRAAAPGRVAYVGWLSSFGLIVVVEHDKGFFTLYGHNASVAKAAGDEVDTGDVLASVGNTGGYERSGLYFEVRRGTDPLDPREWLVP